MPVVARVQQLWIFPVKSMRGAAMDTATVSESGLAGDRAWAVVDEDGTPVTAAQEPRLREVATSVADGAVRLDIPGAEPGLAPEDASDALGSWLGRTVQLAHREGNGFVDVAPVHLVSVESMTTAGHAQECEACDIRHPRANLVVSLSAGGSERDWLGGRLSIGTATLPVVQHPDHCLGVYADVATAGEVGVGDEVTLG